MKRCALTILASLSLGAAPTPRLSSDAVIDAAERAPVSGIVHNMEWNEPGVPFRVMENIHYVGTKTISAWLITGKKGHILIDGAVPQSAPQIIGNIRSLGFDIADVKFLLNSHAHFDHAGGLAGLQRASGAKMLASAGDKPFLEAGDIGHGPSAGMKFPPIRVDRVLRDGEVIRLGSIALTAHITPGHSPGCTSFSKKVKDAGGKPRTAFFHCSATVAGQSLVPEAYPGMVSNYSRTFARLKGTKVDIFLANHDNFFDLHKKRAKQIAGDANAFVDPTEFAKFNSTMEAAFAKTLAEEQAKAGKAKP